MSIPFSDHAETGFRLRMPPEPFRFILASQSPRRCELAIAAGWDVVVAAPPEHVEATARPQAVTEPLTAFVVRLAAAKAAAVAADLPAEISQPEGRMILACDTLGEIDGIPLGKPRDRADAAAMIQRLSGRQHRVVTGVSLWVPAASDRNDQSDASEKYAIINGHAESQVFMETITAQKLEAYLETGAWQGKAGSCGLQDGLLPLQLVEGSADTVVGLPVSLIEQLAADTTRS